MAGSHGADEMTPMSFELARGAEILQAETGCRVPCEVETPSGRVACWIDERAQGGVRVTRQSDGRASNSPMAYEDVYLDDGDAERCRTRYAEHMGRVEEARERAQMSRAGRHRNGQYADALHRTARR